MTYRLEPMAEAHRAAVVGILNHYVTHGFAAYFEEPLPETFFDRLCALARGYPSVVAITEAGAVVGFGLLHPWHPAPTFRRTAEISYFLHSDHRRRGIGKRILDHCVDGARRMGVDNLLASISSRNDESLAFHRKYGFEEVGRFPAVGRKRGVDFDVVWMQRRV
jgi:L-amino acid N-acyltransferase YncA